MKNSLKAYVDGLFADAVPSPALDELHDEILSNLSERYDDCIKAGMSPQRAFTAVIGTMGDVSGLIAQVSGSGVHEVGIFEKISPKSRLFEKYAYVFTEDNLKSIKDAVISVMWLAIVIIYFLVSFLHGGWTVTWLIFVIGAALTVAVNTASKIMKYSRAGDDPESRIKLLSTVEGGVTSIMWLAIVVVYFIGSFASCRWDISWLIFVVGAAAQIIISLVFKIQKSRFNTNHQ